MERLMENYKLSGWVGLEKSIYQIKSRVMNRWVNDKLKDFVLYCVMVFSRVQKINLKLLKIDEN